mmetsp:Transcript_17135/g.19751  ORF Transcript_17135/g.19751 Transcript_17135/m.19751 type:complete len:87 (+) Transcript_17135:128-388(+)
MKVTRPNRNTNADASLTNFQRKIISFHALYLAMNDANNKPPSKTESTATQRQHNYTKFLIVWASQTDQILIQAGLARIVKIFTHDQ